MVRWWPATDVPDGAAPDLRAAVHPSRRRLEHVLRDPADQESWTFLAHTYDEMSGEWSQWADDQHLYVSPLRAGLDRARRADWVLEVGCGTGQAGPVLDRFTAFTVCTDVNLSMLAAAPRTDRRLYLAADVRRMPFVSASVPLLVGLNAVPHIGEFRRLVAESGQLLWCSSFGPGTPLYVTVDELISLMGDGWDADAGHAGHGEWVLLTRKE